MPYIFYNYKKRKKYYFLLEEYTFLLFSKQIKYLNIVKTMMIGKTIKNSWKILAPNIRPKNIAIKVITI